LGPGSFAILSVAIVFIATSRDGALGPVGKFLVHIS
jgi:hypothetical protein